MIDLAFLLDSSGSVGPVNFKLEKKLVGDTIVRFSVGPGGTHVAVISYSGFAVINFQLNNFTTRDQIQSAVQQVQYFDIPGRKIGARKLISINILNIYLD